MSGITEFLWARYTEAREAEAGCRSVPAGLPFQWTAVYTKDDPHVLIDGVRRMGEDEFFEKYGEPSSDPAGLADLDAKLAVLNEHQDVNDGSCGTCVHGRWGYPTHGGSSPQPFPCRTLRLLAAPFAAYPDYDERWRP
ncbi:DUF6221 family protein [Streptomyces sp. NBC_01373]|uniref:DUF6221 family protein n=1 Tax=Streptomyces sp. NBC_01373 TaxID=2903843 RepID=UPI002256D124|nr:DUF6221 family protein [Streptomyces sp. NBC_01373]MCX4704371.1 DUF6221 family protein [Streptomyces sp. NBC_01373]MCX4707111.1 DUF6221 family protein [Streptomyces sp. NBC_01373]